MVRKSLVIVIITLSALLAIGSTAQTAQLVQGLPESQKVQANVKDGEHREFFDTAVGGVPTVVFTVPDGKTFVLTDALFSEDTLGGTKTQIAKVYRGTRGRNCDPNAAGFLGDDLFIAIVKPEENVAYHFKTGYEFRAGERICYLGTITGIGTGISFSLVGGLKLAGEIPAQPSGSGQDLEISSFENGWNVETFTSIKFEDNVWELVVENGVCNTYSTRPKSKDDPASVMFSHLELVTTRSYSNSGVTVKVCDRNVYLPPAGTGSATGDDE